MTLLTLLVSHKKYFSFVQMGNNKIGHFYRLDALSLISGGERGTLKKEAVLPEKE